MLTHKDYKIGWICALPEEQAAAIAMLDESHTSLVKPPSDINTYTLGSIRSHNIVIACLHIGKRGTLSAATVVVHMVNTFPAIRFGLMVGIGAGIPPKVRLGDVVVSVPVGPYPGVLQWNMGKVGQSSTFKRTGALNNPPTLLLAALSRLESNQEMLGSKLPEVLGELALKYPRLAAKYLRPELRQDVLFNENHDHVSKDGKRNDKHQNNVDGNTVKDTELDKIEDDGEESEEYEENCRYGNKVLTVKREPHEMKIHYGLIASSNHIIKNAEFRESLVKELGDNLLCVEVEAAGLMNNFPCIVIRGICDYADSYKNKVWQGHAAAVAAAYAKELLEDVLPEDVDKENTYQDTLSGISQITNPNTDNATIRKQILDTKEDIKILNWLSSNQYSAQQAFTLKRWHPETSQWFLRSKEYQDWIHTKKRTLYCPGIPGAGKTMTASAVIHDLTYRLSIKPNKALAYVFFTFSQQREQTLEHILGSLLRQFLKACASIPDRLRFLYTYHMDYGTKATYEDLMESLSLVISGFDRAFIVMDALDESTAEHQCRAKILTEVVNLQAKFGVNILVTSQMHDEIASKFIQDTTVLPVIAQKEDMEIVLRRRMEAHDPELFDPDFCNEVTSKIIQTTPGMFLLADLHLNTLIGLPTKADIKKVLRNLSKSEVPLNTAYKLAMERIQSQGSGYGHLATMMLLWVVHARRPLSTLEIQYALAIQPNIETVHPDYIPSVKILQSICAELVVVDEETDMIRLIHHTAQEYFEQAWENWFPDAEDTITRTCITYLSFQNLAGHCATDGKFEQRLRSYPLYNYAVHNWGHHARASRTSSVNSEIIRFLQKQPQVQALSQALEAVKEDPGDIGYSQNTPRGMTGLHMAALFGVESAVKALLNTCPPDKKNSHGLSPLMLAAKNGHVDVVRLLLNTGNVDIDAETKESGRTSLSLASEGGHTEVVKLLLNTGNVDINAKDTKYGQTPLFWAAKGGYMEVFRLLLQTENIDIDAQDVDGQTLLMWTAEGGHIEMFKLLLDTGKVDINKRNSYSWSSLDFAACGGHIEVVQLLLKTGNVEVDSKDCNGTTPFILAACEGHLEMAKLLLGTGNVDIDAQDANSGTALSWAAEGGHVEIVKLLLNIGTTNMKTRDIQGKTPLSAAAKGGHIKVVELLINTGIVDVDAKDEVGQTPLSWAVEGGYTNVVKLLLDIGNLDVDTKETEYGQTPLLRAAKGGYTEVVKLLLNTGNVDVDTKDYNDWTPLLRAADGGYIEVVKLLLDTGNVDFDAKDTEHGQTPLLRAAKGGYADVVKLLLDTGNVDVDVKDTEYSQTPLLWAAEEGYTEVVKLLLETGNVNVDAKDTRYGQTPLLRAARGGHVEVVKLLLSTGNVDVDAKDMKYCQTPLLWAAKGGHVEVVKILLETGNVNINTRGEDGRTPLTWAAGGGYVEIVQLLLDTGNVDMKAIDEYGQTTVSVAAQVGHIEVVKLLLGTGTMDVDVKDKLGKTPLLWAAEGGYTEVVKLLLITGNLDVNSKNNHGETPLSLAVQGEYTEVVKLLLDVGNVEVDIRDNTGRTPLFEAVGFGYPDLVKLLLDTRKVDINTKSMGDWTPLFSAARGGRVEIVKLLLDTGKFDMKAIDEYGRTPLSVAAEVGHLEVVKLLLGTGIMDVDVKDKSGKTPLLWAAEGEHTEVVKLLLDAGNMDINAKDRAGRTPLLWAAKVGCLEMVELLLDIKNVNFDIRDTEYGRTPLLWAAKGGHLEVVRLLLHTGNVEVDSRDDTGRTPLFWAVKGRHTEVVRLLLDTGRVEVDLKDEDDRTLLSLAVRNGDEVIASALLAYGANVSIRD